jgi:type IV pilus assembly protein PilA
MADRSIITNNPGFTLIELLIVIAIIGILAAIAIPQFATYRTRSHNTSAMSDLRNIATAQEGYYVDNKVYANSLSTLISDYGLVISDGVNAGVNGSSDAYVITAYHTSGNKTYTLEGPGGVISE